MHVWAQFGLEGDVEADRIFQPVSCYAGDVPLHVWSGISEAEILLWFPDGPCDDGPMSPLQPFFSDMPHLKNLEVGLATHTNEWEKEYTDSRGKPDFCHFVDGLHDLCFLIEKVSLHVQIHTWQWFLNDNILSPNMEDEGDAQDNRDEDYVDQEGQLWLDVDAEDIPACVFFGHISDSVYTWMGLEFFEHELLCIDPDHTFADVENEVRPAEGKVSRVLT